MVQSRNLRTAPPCQKGLPQKPDYLFRLMLGLHPDIGDDRTVTLILPAAEAELLDAQEQLGVEGWEGVTVIDYDGIIPYAAEFTDLPMELEELNAFTKAVRDIPRSEVPKLKALLEQFEVQDIETAMLLTEHLADYILMPNLSSPQEAALDQLCFIMNREEAVRLIPYVNLFNYGETVIHADNAALTSYGLLHRADYEPMLSPMQQKQEKEMTMCVSSRHFSAFAMRSRGLSRRQRSLPPSRKGYLPLPPRRSSPVFTVLLPFLPPLA